MLVLLLDVMEVARALIYCSLLALVLYAMAERTAWACVFVSFIVTLGVSGFQRIEWDVGAAVETFSHFSHYVNYMS